MSNSLWISSKRILGHGALHHLFAAMPPRESSDTHGRSGSSTIATTGNWTTPSLRLKAIVFDAMRDQSKLPPIEGIMDDFFRPRRSLRKTLRLPLQLDRSEE